MHNYSYLIMQINNYNKCSTFLLYVILVYKYNVYLSQRRALSYLNGCRIFVVRINLLVLTRPNLANNYPNGSVDFFHVHFVIVIVLVIQVLFRSNFTFYLKELGTSRTHSAVIRCLTICQHIPVVRKNHKNQLTQQFDVICCLARGLTLCIESKQIMSLLSCESATLKRGPQLFGQRCGPYLRH